MKNLNPLLAILAIPLLSSCSTLLSETSVFEKARVPVADATAIGTAMTNAFKTADLNQDGDVAGLEWLTWLRTAYAAYLEAEEK